MKRGFDFGRYKNDGNKTLALTSFQLSEKPKVMRKQAVLFKSNQNSPGNLANTRISGI